MAQQAGCHWRNERLNDTHLNAGNARMFSCCTYTEFRSLIVCESNRVKSAVSQGRVSRGCCCSCVVLQAIVGFIKSVSSVYIPQICMPAYRLDDVWQAYYPNMLAAYEIFKIAKGLESNIWRAINSITQICLNGPCLGMKHRPEEPCGVSSWERL